MGIPTPHISAGLGDFAETVLMPGDPLRAEYIAKNFLENAKKVTSIRNMLGFTGTYKRKVISVMGSGMGIPSMSIYAKELYTEYDVQNIIRVGSCGAIAPELELRDVLIAMGASTDSKVNRQRLSGCDFSAICDYGLLEKAVKVARKKEKNVKVGNLFSTDLFYGPDSSIFSKMIKMGILGVEMEAAGLYGVAAECGKKAIAICTVSDHIIKKQALSAEERQTTFNDMVEISLEL